MPTRGFTVSLDANRTPDASSHSKIMTNYDANRITTYRVHPREVPRRYSNALSSLLTAEIESTTSISPSHIPRMTATPRLDDPTSPTDFPLFAASSFFRILTSSVSPGSSISPICTSQQNWYVVPHPHPHPHFDFTD